MIRPTANPTQPRPTADALVAVFRRAHGRRMDLGALVQATGISENALDACLRALEAHGAVRLVAPRTWVAADLDGYEEGLREGSYLDRKKGRPRSTRRPVTPEARCCPYCALMPWECECPT